MSTAYLNHLESRAGPVESESEPGAVDRFHDYALHTFLESATDLHQFGHTADELARLVVRHLTPQVAPYPDENEYEAGHDAEVNQRHEQEMTR